jgi:GNAT superfamily N-acetyltransferase
MPLLNYDVIESDGIITFKNQNTTLGFIRYSEGGVIEYIFVQPMYRKKGLATRLLSMVEDKAKKQLIFLPPISKLGQTLINSYTRQ